MENNSERIQAVVNPKIKQLYDELFISTGANSRGDFIAILLNSYANPETKTIEKEIEVEVEKVVEQLVVKEVPVKLAKNQLIVSLSPIQEKLLNLAVDFHVNQDGEVDEIEEGYGDMVLKGQNYYATSPSFHEKYTGLFTPLNVAEPSEINKERILKNCFAFSVYKQYDITPQFSRSELRSMVAEIKGSEDQQKSMVEFVKSLNPDQKKELFGDLIKPENHEENEAVKEIEKKD